MCFPDLSVKFNRTDYIIVLPNGSEIGIYGLGNDKEAEKLLGTQFSTIYFNEASEIAYSGVQLVLSRLAEKNDLTKRVWFDFNPPAKSHWSYWLFIKGLNPADAEPLSNPGDYSYLLMNPKDNLANIDEEYIKLLEAMPEKERDRFLNGLFADSDDGRAYYAFDREAAVDPTIRRLHGQVYVFMDFNVNPMTACVASICNDEIHVFDEVFLNNSDTQKMAIELKKRGYHGTVIPDSTGRNRKTSGRSDFLILEQAGFRIESVHNPLQVDRVNNMNKLFSDNRIKIHPRCKKLINDFERVSWKDNKLDQTGENKMLTHISDACGYGAWRLFPITGVAQQVYSTNR